MFQFMDEDGRPWINVPEPEQWGIILSAVLFSLLVLAAVMWAFRKRG